MTKPFTQFCQSVTETMWIKIWQLCQRKSIFEYPSYCGSTAPMFSGQALNLKAVITTLAHFGFREQWRIVSHQ